MPPNVTEKADVINIEEKPKEEIQEKEVEETKEEIIKEIEESGVPEKIAEKEGMTKKITVRTGRTIEGKGTRQHTY